MGAAKPVGPSEPADTSEAVAVTAPVPRLRLEGMVKDYTGTRVVDGVSLELWPGEVLGLIGENGAGKSTLIKMISGIVEPSAGQMWIDGQPVSFSSTREAQAAGVSVVYQELTLVPHFNAVENVFLGKVYPRTAVGLANFRALRQAAQKIFDGLETILPLDVPVMELSPAMQSMVSIARALATKARVFILDEPTAALTHTETEHLFKVIQLLKARGVGLIYISHRLEEVLRVTDRIIALRDGKLVGTVATAEATMDGLIGMMLGRTVAQMFASRQAEIGGPLLEVSELSGPGIAGASFVLRRGEILGIAGLAGSGRTELLRILAGAARPSSGSIKLNGKPYKPKSPREALRAGVAMVPEERRSMGLILSESIANNLVMSNLGAISRAGWISNGRRKSLAQRLVREVHVKTTGIGQAVGELSGGNQQKVVFGKCMARDITVLLLDEPTRGVDVGSKQEIYEIVRAIAANGTGVILVSSDLPEIVGLADRIVILKDNTQCGIVDGHDMDERRLVTCCNTGVLA